MLFTSYAFLFLFLPVFFLLYLALPAKGRVYLIVIGSYIFYGFWRLDFCLLLLGVSLVGYLGGLGLAAATEGRTRRAALLCSLTLLLAALSWFKYAGFLGESWNGLADLCRLPADLRIDVPEIILPVGISFFTFQSISYVVDVHRGMQPTRSWVEYFAYIALFPQLVAGPIVRYGDISTELKSPVVSFRAVEQGIVIFMIGFCKKVWLANNLGPMADWAFSLQEPPLSIAWLGLLSYTLQIYFDFCGYSDMAIGLGLMLGFHFPENFRAPYRSTSIAEFWQRWHVTMSSFFRDYLYIPLGGNRKGHLRTMANLLVTMFLAGLWHGAGWTFILWGLWHGALLAVNRAWTAAPRPFLNGANPLDRLACGALTLFVVMLGWAPFRAADLQETMAMLRGLFGGFGSDSLALLDGRANVLFWIALLLGGALVWVERRPGNRIFQTGWGKLGLLLLFVGAVHELGDQAYNPFLYFQF